MNEVLRTIRSIAIRAAVAAAICGASMWRCANPVAPQGGPKDSLPPRVVIQAPHNGITNFKEKRIYIEFDEYVKLKDQQKEFFVSPAMKKIPTITMRGKGLLIDIKDTLPENTTFALNFGGMITDNNEGNVMSDYRYVFSTGPEIDSMFASGYTVDAYTRDSIGKVSILFFPADSVQEMTDSVELAELIDSLSDTGAVVDTAAVAAGFPGPVKGRYTLPELDSTLFKLKAAVIGRAQPNGRFIVQNLKPIPYWIYALDDKNNNGTYEPGVDRVGFLDEPQNPADLPDFTIWYDTMRRYMVCDPQLYMRLFMDKPFKRQLLTTKERPLQNMVKLVFSAPDPIIEDFSIQGIEPDSILREYLRPACDSIAYWLRVSPERLGDTLVGMVRYHYHDSVSNLVPRTDTLKLTWRKFEEKRRDRDREKKEEEKPVNPFKYTIDPQGKLNPEREVTLTLDCPAERVDTSQMLLTRIDGEKIYKVRFTLTPDTFSLRSFHLKAVWTPNQKYKLEIPAGALTDVLNQSNDTIRTEWTTLNPDEFASQIFHVKGKTPQSKYILQLLDSGGKVIEEKRGVKTGDCKFNYIPVGTVKLRVIEDDNGNGVWDAGDLRRRIQPERVEMFTAADGGQEIITKANWEGESNLDMADLFKPVTMEALAAQLRQAEIILQRKRAEAEAKNKTQYKSDQKEGGGMGFGSAMGGMTGGLPGRTQ